ncbi:MAG TPA: ABC transporter substrate-binding protein [Streptosporangiaceae bacterium]|nr:ABC transporter substrate-binding protein [Streptosporangiaceae bacterium]
MRRGALAVLAAAALGVAACSSSPSSGAVGGQAGSKSLVVASTSSVQKLDPQIATNFVDFQALGLVYQPLITLNSQFQITPDLATSWSFSNGDKALTFHLRPGVTFDDGSTLTSADVKASLERVLSPKTGAVAASNISTVTAVADPAPDTVVLTLSHPDFSILYGLTTINVAILPQKAISAGTVASHPDGTGPFTFVSWAPGNSLTLARNPHYWGGAPSIGQVVFRAISDEQSIASALQAGTVQMGLLNQPQVVKTLAGAGLTVDQELGLSYRALMLQDQHGPLANVNARLAVACALNRTDILSNAVLGAGKVVGPVPLGPYAGHTTGQTCGTQDLAQARQYLAKAHLPGGFSFTAMISNDLDATSQAQAVTAQSDLAKVGIHMSIQNVAQNDYIQRWLKGQFQAAFAENGANPDPYTMYGRYFGAGANLGVPAGYASPALASMLTQADEAPAASARAQLDQQIISYLQDNAVWVWLFDSYNYTVLTSTVHGFTPLPDGQLTALAHTTLP